MKKMKKAIALLMALAMTAGIASGCSSGETSSGSAGSEGSPASAASETGEIDTSEPVELKMYLIGDRTPDFYAVYDKINEILQ